MFKKVLIASAILAASTSAFAATGPYVGASLGVDNTTYDAKAGGTVDFGERNANLNIFGGYGTMIAQNFYLGGELFVNANSDSNVDAATVDDTTLVSLKKKYSYGVSLIPGVMLTDHTMAYARAGVVKSRFETTAVEYTEDTVTGAQLGMGMQTNITQNLDLRGEYVYTAYNSYHVNDLKITPTSDQFNLGLVYNFG